MEHYKAMELVRCLLDNWFALTGLGGLDSFTCELINSWLVVKLKNTLNRTHIQKVNGY